MPKVSVPLFSFRLLLFLCFALMIAVSFFSGLILLEGGNEGDRLYNAAVLGKEIEQSGIPDKLRMVASGKSARTELTAPANRLLKPAAIRSVFIIEQKSTNKIWETPYRKDSRKTRIAASVASGIWKGTLVGKLFRDADGKRYLYPAIYTFDKKMFAVVLELNDRPGFFARLLQPLRKGVTKAFGENWYRPAALLGVMLLAAVLVVFSSTAVFLTRPVRIFTGVLESWSTSGLPGGKSLGLLRGSMKYVEELVSRRSGDTRAAAVEPVLEQLLPVRQGYDFPGVDTAALFVKRLDERKDFYDMFSLPDGRLCIFRGEVSGHGHEASVATARMAVAAQAYGRTFTDPARVVAEINTLFYAIYGSLAVSLFVGFLDVSKKEFLFSQAGGLPLFRFEGDLDGVAPFHLDIPPAGMIPPEMFRERLRSGQLSLEPGSLFALLTDGLLKLSGFEWENVAAELLSGSKPVGEKVIAFRNAITEAAEAGSLQDDLAGLFFQVH